jgi:hypothetical protein
MDHDKPSLYDTDFFRWTSEQADLLRRGHFAEADLANIVEEIETLGRSEKRELASAYRLICLHLLKLLVQPSRATRSWRKTIVRERNTAERVLDDNPSLKGRRADILAGAYKQARKEAAAETGLPVSDFPDTPPFTLEQVEADDFLPATVAGNVPGQTIEDKNGQS